MVGVPRTRGPRQREKRETMRYIVACVLAAASSAQGSVLIDFEGMVDQDLVLGYYGGGASNFGAVGPNFGVTFSANGQVLIDSDAGGTGDFANEPSSNAALFPAGPDGSIMINVPAGFTSFSTWFTNVNLNTGFIHIYDGPNGTGTQVPFGLGALPHAGVGDPNGFFDVWALIEINLGSVTGHSIVLGSTDSTAIGFDNMEFTIVPAPSAAAVAGLAMILVRRRRRP